MGFLLLEVRGRSKDLQILILPFNISYLQNSFLHVLHIIGSCDKYRPGSIVLLYKRRKKYPEKLNNYMIRQLWNQEKNTTFAIKYFSPSTLHRNKSHSLLWDGQRRLPPPSLFADGRTSRIVLMHQ